MKTQAYWEKYGDAIIGRMKAEGATDNSTEEIHRCMIGCVAGSLLIKIANEARNKGLFQWVTK